jgi:hypothetical protein
MAAEREALAEVAGQLAAGEWARCIKQGKYQAHRRQNSRSYR